MGKKYWRRNLIYPYLFILPFIVFFMVFDIWPIFHSLSISFLDMIGLGKANFIGLGNYSRLFSDANFYQSLRNTVHYVIGTTLLQIPAALLLALVVNSMVLKLRSFFRTSAFLPVITSAPAVSIIFTTILDYRYGLFNMLLEKAGLSPVNWLQDMNLVMWSIILVGVWRFAGYNMIYFLAGLQGIPPELYEAAAIDGAKKWQLFRYITFPCLRPVLAFVFITHMIGALQVFEIPYLLTQGGPAGASTTINLYLYQNAFSFFRFGYGCSIAYLLFLIIFIISLGQMKFFGLFRREVA